jgi:hypothetical protein
MTMIFDQVRGNDGSVALDNLMNYACSSIALQLDKPF